MAYLPHIDDPSVFCDSTVFSDLNSTTSSLFLPMSELEGKTIAGRISTAARAPSTPAHIFPVLPSAHNFSALGNPKRFDSYIRAELPLALNGNANSGPLPPPPPPPPTERLRRNVNSVFLNTLLKRPAQNLIGTLQWIETDVFPDNKLPVPFNKDLVKSSATLWDKNTRVIPRAPKDMTEDSIRTWLNNIANNLAVTHNIALDTNSGRADRGFDSRTAKMGPSGGYMLRKPDISLIDRAERLDDSKSAEERLHWRKIYAFIEVTSNNSNPLGNVLTQISEKAACVFDVQHPAL